MKKGLGAEKLTVGRGGGCTGAFRKTRKSY